METQIYSASWCGGCRRLKSYLDSKQITYTVKDIENDIYKDELLSLGFQSIPVLVKGDVVISGFDKNKVDELFGI